MNNDKNRGSEGLHSRDGHYPESGRVAIDSLDVKDLRDLIDELHVHKIELEAARAKSENDRRLLLAVMEALPVGVAITDANGGSVLSNNAYEQIWSGPRPLPRSIDEYSSYKAWWPDSGATVAPEEWASAIAVRKGETTVGQLMRIQRFDGTQAFVINSASPVRDADGNIIGCAVAIQDINDLKMAEEALRENELKASALINAAGESIWMFGLDGKILAANAVAARRVGCVPDQIIGRYWMDLIPAELVEPRAQRVAEVVRTGEPVHFEDTRAGMFLDHSIYPVHDRAGNITSVALFTRDVTAHKVAEAALIQSREDLNRAQEVGSIGSWRLDVRGNVLVWSDENHRIFGVPKGTPLTYETFLACVHPDDREYVDTNWKAALNGKPYDIEHRLLVDGRCKWVREKAYLEIDDDGTLIGGFGITQDITKRKEAEEELQKAHNELEVRVRQRTEELATTVEALLGEIANREKAEKILIEETLERARAEEVLREKEQMLLMQNRHTAMGEMIGNIAHQWRQPLNTLGLITQRLGAFYGSPSFNKELLETSVSKSMEIINHMSRTIDDFRNFFSNEREKSEFRVNDALLKALSLVEANFKDSGIKIIHNKMDDISIYGFPNEYAQVLLNIFINAKDAINERMIESPCLTVSVSNENGRSVVTIADNAGGIPENIIEKIFDPYFTTKGPQQGTGVGLFMSKTIIEKNMGGRLLVRNSDTGAEFRIEV
ncbi:MAG: PAS domain S-box protein [Deltaproteobacteria bacterium]|nr:PAS domain S-box protein [Deltaproteobacteria bacterium]